jgi:beta-glucosidase
MLSRTPRSTLLTGAMLAALVAGGAVWQQANAAAGDPYLNASLPVADRVNDLLSRMTLDDKAGQMTQADLLALSATGNSTSDVATYRLGSVLSGGGSDPSDISASG